MLLLSLKLFWYLIPVAVIILTSCASGKDGSSSRLSDDAGLSEVRLETEKILQYSRVNRFSAKDAERALVLSVLDGDTIEAELIDEDGGKGKRIVVRYAGMDAPEYDHPIQGTEPMGRAATERNRQLVEGQVVHLETDGVDEDHNGRKLRFVYLDDVMINLVLVYEGLAQVQVDSLGRPTKYMGLLSELQNRAILDRRGGWERDWNNFQFDR